ncbi:MAG: M14 family metallopeptidase [Rhodanobacteraceae bacterium]|nr:M14 family metallopeptidase [Xanthomonadales bacterium]MCP5478429.1 M14 family metallopeptidase [Rhodanobacteraceae bacterium]HPF72573.1 M14 family metallopeptidase [Xanthomonadaceae bacterium]HRX99923.1 M14 family metallopeptidase [Xanthomonadaceae bacterium]
MNPASRLLAGALALVAIQVLAADPSPLSTVSERSGFKKTGRYDEVIALCGAFAERYPDAVRCIDFGVTPQGRHMKAMVVSRSGSLDADSARRNGVPVLLVQGGIHAGEIDGKDAGFLAVRQALDGEAAKGSLQKQVLLFVPVFNVDGHERFGAWNRPNQRGPEEMGWRTTAQNLNLNRDYLKADAPEMRAMLRMIKAWDPIAYVDLHVTDGAKFRHDVSIQIEPLHAGDAALKAAGQQMSRDMLDALKKQGSLPLPFYPSFVTYDDPSSGFVDGVPPPRFSHGYFWLRNRFGMLVETHSWKDYPTRVRITRNAVINMLEQTAEHGREWLKLANEADQRSAELAGKPVDMEFTASDRSHDIDFLGYAYTRSPSEISGALMTRYDESKPATWTIPLRDDIQPSTVINAPGAGYIVPAQQARLVRTILSLHGIQSEGLRDGMAKADVRTFRAAEAKPATGSMEGHQRMTFTGAWQDEQRSIPAGSVFVPIAQPEARLVMAILEPMLSDSLAAWGEFNNAFEGKEYMEPYVAEEVAREMLRNDPKLQSEFAHALEDPAFAADPFARLNFFYKRHASFDERLNLYPVYRVDRWPQ